jgi:opacity protein-like surface antigen
MSKHTMLAAALALVLPAGVNAQSSSYRSSSYDEHQPSVVFFANGGGYSPLTDLNANGTASLNTGWSLGGGAGIQANRFVALRAVFDFGQDKGDAGSTAFAGQKIRRYFYGGDVQLRYPMASGFAPYVLAGVGAVTIDPVNDPFLDRFTNLAGKAGLGAEYNMANGLGLFVQGTSYFYKFDRAGLDKTQADLLWNAGLSYRYRL